MRKSSWDMLDLVQRGPMLPQRANSRGSPFQMPARLAVGLGLESGPRNSHPFRCAPSSPVAKKWFPRVTALEATVTSAALFNNLHDESPATN